MICKAVSSARPKLHPTVRAAENAAVIGDVCCEREVSIWYGVTLRGDSDSIWVGEETNIQDGCIFHCDAGAPVRVGRRCVIGHGAIVHGCTVGDETLIGMGATLLSGCVVGKGCVIGANALLTGGMTVPDGWLVMGVPAKLIRPVRPEELAHTLENVQEYCALAREGLPAVGGAD